MLRPLKTLDNYYLKKKFAQRPEVHTPRPELPRVTLLKFIPHAKVRPKATSAEDTTRSDRK